MARQRKSSNRSTAETASARNARRRYFINLGLLLVVFLLLAAWYQRHLQVRVAGLAVGGSLTVLALLRMVYDFATWGAADEVKGLPRRLLSNQRVTVVLAGAIPAAGLLLLGTSSLHFEVDASRDHGAGYVVEVVDRRTDQVLVAPRRLAGKGMESQPFFGRWRATPLLVRVREPSGFQAVPANLTVGGRVLLKVPSDFPSKLLRVVRLLPGPGLAASLPRPGAPALTPYDVLLKRAGRTNVIPDWHQQVICLGANPGEIALALAREPAVARRDAFSAYLDHVHLPADSRGPILKLWEAAPRLEATDEFREGERIQVLVVRSGNRDPVISAETQIPTNGEIHNVFLKL